MFNWFDKLSIRRKLVLMITFVSSASFLIGIGISLVFSAFSFRDQAVEDVRTIALMTAHDCSTAITGGKGEHLRHIIELLAAKQSIEYAAVFDKHGALLVSYSRSEGAEPDIVEYRAEMTQEVNADHLAVWQPIMHDGQYLGTVALYTDYTEFRSLIASVAALFVPLIFASFGIAYIFAIRVQRVFSDPVVSLAKTARRVSQSKNYAMRAQKYSDDEIGQLTEAFNDMLEQVGIRNKAIIESEERYRAFVRNSTEPTFRLDYPDPIPIDAPMDEKLALHRQRATLDEFNQAFSTAYGYSAEDFRDHPELLFGMTEHIMRAVFDPQNPAVNIEGTIRTKSGAVKTMLSSVTRTVENGELRRVWITQRDVSDLRSAEQEQDKLAKQLRHVQKMDSIGQLAGGIAHDFNNLLVAILGYTELAKDIGETNELPESMPAYLDEIEKAASRAAALTRQLLASSRRQIMEMSSVDMAQTLTGIEQLLQRLIPEHIDLHINAPDSPLVVRGDVGQLEQVIVNLAVNARDAMPGGGVLEIDLTRETLDENRLQSQTEIDPGDSVLLRVRDTGEGMSPDIREHLFEPFFTTKPKGKGTGLGLAVALGILQHHGGFIEVDSAIGSGTTMEVFLPAAPEVTAPSSESTEAEASGGTETILLVEDEAQVRSLAVRILTRVGYTVLEAENGEDALEIFDEHESKIDLLLVDVVMPKMGGKELMEAVRKRGASIPILFTSGYSSGAIHDGFILEAGLDFLAKPYKRVDLESKVRAVLDRHTNAAS